jgi:hypothetical protein
MHRGLHWLHPRAVARIYPCPSEDIVAFLIVAHIALITTAPASAKYWLFTTRIDQLASVCERRAWREELSLACFRQNSVQSVGA